MLRKFIYKFILFSLPLLIIVSIPIPFGLYFGDLLPASQIIALQEKHNGLYLPSGVQKNILEYKLEASIYHSADFLVIGSSRFQYISADFVTNPEYRFYNASVLGQSPQNMLNMLEIIAEQDAMPQILYMNIDLNHLNADCIQTACISDIDIAQSNIVRARQAFIRAYNDLALDLFFDFESIEQSLNKVRDDSRTSTYRLGRGTVPYRLDGSHYSSFSANQVDDGFVAHETTWLNQSDIYQAGSDISAETLDVYAQILKIAEAHDTVVIAVLPPYHPNFYVRLENSPDHRYFETAREAIVTLFDSKDAILLDFTNPDNTTIESATFYDSWHLAEVGSLQLYLDVLNQYPEILLPYSDPVILAELLENAPDSFNLNSLDTP